MSAHDFWHPVLRTKDIKRKPISANFCGRKIAVFRGEDGRLGALEDCCPHRRMQLSRGWVEGNRLVCPYHGWSYDQSGAGISPATPALRPCVKSYDVAERYGAIWVKELDSTAELPNIARADFYQMCTLHYHIRAPLPVVVDNFSEIEHSCTTHLMFGHDLQGIASVENSMEVSDEAIRIVNKGPQKRMPWVLERILGYKRGDLFVGELEILFSPVRVNIKNCWISPTNAEGRKGEAEGAVVFNPVNDQETEVMLFAFVSSELSLFGRFLNPLSTFWVDYENTQDKHMIEAIADKNPKLLGMKLGRFDQPLGLIRERIERIYYRTGGVNTPSKVISGSN